MDPLNPWWWLGATLGWNFQRHRMGLATLCSTFRAHCPPWVFIAGWAALTAWLAPHVIRGYPKAEVELSVYHSTDVPE